MVSNDLPTRIVKCGCRAEVEGNSKGEQVGAIWEFRLSHGLLSPELTRPTDGELGIAF